MADIASWSPVDESNTAAPPDGWPENMQPSAVNNCARALMGAVRRFYDTVTTQISDITTSLAGYLPLSGGTVTGNLTVNGALTGANTVATTGTNAAYSFADRTGGGNWLWYSTGGIARLWMSGDRITVDTGGNILAGGNINGQTITGSQIISAGNINASGNINATNDISCRDLFFRNCTASGNLNGNALYCDAILVVDVSGGNPLIYKAGGAWGIQLQSAATFYDNNAHYFRNNGAANTFTIDASGNVNATAQVQGATIYSRGDITAVGNITASAAISAAGGITAGTNLYAGGAIDGAYVQSRGDANFAGTATFNKIRITGELRTSNWIIPNSDNASNVGLPSGLNFSSMHAYAFVVPSDERLKTDIQDIADCLPLLEQIQPRTYRLTGSPDEARWGFVAQQIGEVMRLNNREFAGHHVATDPDTGEEHHGLDTHQMLALLWKATQELAAEVKELRDARHL